MNFPTLVYRTPGVHFSATGTYDYRGVDNAEALEAALDDGWFLTLQGAINGVEESLAPIEESEPEPEGLPLQAIDAPAVVREWLSARLQEFGVEHEDDMHEDELLFLICHEFAKPADDAPPIDPPEPEIDDAPPTREELEAKAKELNISFDGRTTDRILGEKIASILAEQEQ